MKSVIYWVIGIAVGFYAYYDSTSFEHLRRGLSVLLAVFIIYATTAQVRLERLENANESKAQVIAELMSDLDRLKSKVSALEHSVDDLDKESLVARMELIERSVS